MLPSHVENFAIVVAESLAHAIPVIASKSTPWKGLETNHCGLWVDNDPESLAAAIRGIQTMPLREMGQQGRRWVEEAFSWRSGNLVHLFPHSCFNRYCPGNPLDAGSGRDLYHNQCYSGYAVRDSSCLEARFFSRWHCSAPAYFFLSYPLFLAGADRALHFRLYSELVPT